MVEHLITIDRINKTFVDSDGREIRVLNDITFNINEGDFITVFGPNGAGKTTLLNIIAKTEKPTGGNINFSKSNFKIGYVFQNYDESLLPWRTVENNIALPLENNIFEKQERYNEVDKIIRLLNLEKYRYKYPYLLSGGKKQLTALARALIIEPDILLMDEPFSSLDFGTTLEMEQLLLKIWKELNITILFVSHNIDEAILLADQILVISPSTQLHRINIKLERPRSHEVILSQPFVEIKREVIQKYGAI